MTLKEDACQARKGTAPHTLAAFNRFLLALFDWLEVYNVASQMRLFAAPGSSPLHKRVEEY